MKGISAIVATYKRVFQLKRLFDSLVSNHYDYLELIIVDQNKDNLIDDLITDYKAYLTITHLKIEMPNQSHARNYGAAYAKYPIVCFPDDDCWFEDDSITKISTYFESNPNTDLLIINWKQNPVVNFESRALSKSKIFSYKAPSTYSTYVLFFKKDAFFAIGGFMETIGLGKYIGGGEDTELIFKAAKNDLVMYYEAHIFVNHDHTPVTKRDWQSTRARQRGTGFIYSKYKLNYFVILRGFLAPLTRMIFSSNIKASQAHYHTFMARVEGFIYGIKNK